MSNEGHCFCFMQIPIIEDANRDYSIFAIDIHGPWPSVLKIKQLCEKGRSCKIDLSHEVDVSMKVI